MMNKDILEKNNIFYDDGERRESEKVASVPTHVSFLRGALLDFDLTIPERFGLAADENIRDTDWDHLFKDRDALKVERTSVADAIERYKTIQMEAKFRHDGRDREAEWQTYYFQYFLDPLAKEVQVSDYDTRRTSRAKYYYDAFEWISNRLWTQFQKDSELRRDKRGLTAPKPDYVAYFPIYDTRNGGRTRTSHRWQWSDSPKDGLVTNFSLEILKHLAKKGLQPSPIGIFKESRGDRVDLSDFLCYPWLIVEHKKDDSNNKAMDCYCQAANAASAALTMHQILVKYAKERADDAHIPPVTTMTTVGKIVKVWIAYASGQGTVHEMTCVWTGDVTNIMDVMKLEAILENLHTWAMRELRPWISEYINQWLSQFPKLESESEIGEEDRSLVHIEMKSQSPPEESTSSSSNSATIEWHDLLRSEHKYLLERLETLLTELIGDRPSPYNPRPSTSSLFHNSRMNADPALKPSSSSLTTQRPTMSDILSKPLFSYKTSQAQPPGSPPGLLKTESGTTTSNIVSKPLFDYRTSQTQLSASQSGLSGIKSEAKASKSRLNLLHISSAPSLISNTQYIRPDVKEDKKNLSSELPETSSIPSDNISDSPAVPGSDTDEAENDSPSASRLQRALNLRHTTESTNNLPSGAPTIGTVPLESDTIESKSNIMRSSDLFTPPQPRAKSGSFLSFPEKIKPNDSPSSSSALPQPRRDSLLADDSGIVESNENDSGQARYRYTHRTSSQARKENNVRKWRGKSQDGDDQVPDTI